MTLNPIRIFRCAMMRRQLDRNLAARKQARTNGQIYVSSHTRKA